MKRTAPILVALGGLALAPVARAHDDFPPKIRQHLQAMRAPPCSLCHEGGKTGSGTVYTPFAWAMRARGLTGEEDSVVPALDQMGGVDSDGDGATDTEEIIAGTDPNAPGTAKNIEDPQLGCSAAGTPVRGGLAAIVVGLAAALAGRRRR
jgi:hypothetical protein